MSDDLEFFELAPLQLPQPGDKGFIVTLPSGRLRRLWYRIRRRRVVFSVVVTGRGDFDD